MNELVGTLVGQLPGMLLGAAIAPPIARWHQRASARDGRRVAAAGALIEALGALEQCLRRWMFQPIRSESINTAMKGWDLAWRSHGGVLPADWAHMNQSVRFAVGNAIGGDAAMAADMDVAPGWKGAPFEAHWWDLGLTYLEHLRTRMHDLSLLEKRVHGRHAPVSYDEWRRDEDIDRRSHRD